MNFVNKACIGLFCGIFFSVACFAQHKQSKWIYKGKQGNLEYGATSRGDKISDFSYAGYGGGGVALPTVPTKVKVHPPASGDATSLIQTAIDSVSRMLLKGNFRGAVELSKGVYFCDRPIRIHSKGVVLRGSGSGKDGSVIKMTGEKHAAIIITAEEKINQEKHLKASITDNYVPSGTRVFHLDQVKGYSAGDRILINKPVAESWVQFMEMDNLKRDGKSQTWLGTNRKNEIVRTITGINGNAITIDAPLPDALDKAFTTSGSFDVVRIAKTNASHSGVEHLRVECSPLEVDYRHAPYSGIHIRADDVWCRDIVFNETMNTTVLAGNNITMQEINIFHSFPNLGASKPADFSIEGSFNLIDKCSAIGGNTYFVWTTSLANGPNVVLNSVFKGHGSRIQPHQRWATALLVDNCVIPDGGIDFMNRGVAGSGHGWTMGWGVAWNCVAKFYTIQNPPGTFNWAIGCIGEQLQTARLFDSEPVIKDGAYDAHGSFVAPQSLYLAQLRERKGEVALKNIGYNDKPGEFVTMNKISPSPPLEIIVDPVLGTDLGMFRPVNVSNVRNRERNFGAERALDNSGKYWATDDGVTKAVFEIDTEGPLDINAIKVEEVSALGNRIGKFKIEGQVNSDWKLLAEGNGLADKNIFRFNKETVWKVRLTVLDAKEYIALKRVSLYLKE